MLNFGTPPQKNSNPESIDLQGMAKEIYDLLRPAMLDPGLKKIDDMPNDEDNNLPPETKEQMKTEAIYSMKSLSFYIAKGVITHIKSNMEITGVKSKIDSPNVQVNPGQVVSAPPPTGIGSTTSPGTGQVISPIVSQTNDGTGLVK